MSLLGLFFFFTIVYITFSSKPTKVETSL
jgi:hypothetical protein